MTEAEYREQMAVLIDELGRHRHDYMTTSGDAMEAARWRMNKTSDQIRTLDQEWDAAKGLLRLKGRRLREVSAISVCED